jgi:hypothetical protein
MPILLTKPRLKNPLASQSPEDRKVLFLCLAVAFVFWLLLKLSKAYEQPFVFDVVYDLPVGKSFSDAPPATVTAVLKASGWTFLKMSIRPISSVLHYPVPDASLFLPEQGVFRNAMGAQLPNGADILEVRYDAVRLTLEAKSSRRLAVVVPQRIGFVREYGLLGRPRIIPDSVWVSGPSAALDTLRFWSTDSLVVQDLDADWATMLPLRPPGPGIRLENTPVSVSIRVQRFTEKTFQLPIRVLVAGADSVRVFPDQATVKCIVGVNDYARLAASDLDIIANITTARTDKTGHTVLLNLVRKPDYVQSYTISPRVISYLIQQ